MSGQEGCTSLPVMILNNRHNFNVSLLSDRLGMLRVQGSVAQSQLHDLEQTCIKAITFEQDNMVLKMCYNYLTHLGKGVLIN